MPDFPLPPKLAFPCPKRWDALSAAGSRARFCDGCQLHVHDLSALTRVAGERLLSAGRGQVCVSYVTHSDGTMVVRSHWDGVQRRWREMRRGVLALLAFLAPFSFGGCAPHSSSKNYTLGRVFSPIAGGKDAPPGPPDANRTLGTPLPPTH